MKIIKILILAVIVAFCFNTADAQTGNKTRHVQVVRSRRHHPIKRITLHKHD